MEDLFNDKNFGEKTEVSSQTVDWGVLGDVIIGTFIRARHNVETQFGSNSIYEILAEKGSFHKLTKKVPAKEATTINKNETWAVWGRNDLFNGIMNGLKPGQVIKIAYTEDKDTQMGQAKIIKVYAPRNNDGTPVVNNTWLESQSVVGGDM